MAQDKPRTKRLRFAAAAAAGVLTLQLKVRHDETAELQVRPVSTLLVEQAEWTARLAVEQAARAREADGGELTKAERLGIHFATLIAAIGRAAIVGWDLVDADDRPVPCTPDNVAQALSADPDFAHAFDVAYTAETARRRNEGNGSAPAPNGTSAAGANTALPAGTTTTTPTGAGAPNAPI